MIVEKKSVRIAAYAKINLTLGIGGRRPDGFHSITSVMQTVQLRDSLLVETRPGGGIYVRSTISHIPSDRSNTVYKAAQAYINAGGLPGHSVSFTIDKRIPVGAGLAGGSTDAAAALIAMNSLDGERFSFDELLAIGAEAGSDIPFCIHCGTKLVYGKGEYIQPVDPLPDCKIVIVKPSFSINTAQMFEEYDIQNRILRTSSESMLRALSGGYLDAVAACCSNDFESVLLSGKKYTIDAIKDKLLSGGALSANMTGSGSAVYGLFSSESDARSIADTMRQLYREVYVTAPQRTPPVPARI